LSEGAVMARILVVEDDPDTNEILSKLLRSYGHRTTCAFTGEGALAVIGSARPELVILDIMMPGMDGMEVLRTIRSSRRFATIPVILFSAVADAAFQEQAKLMGATDYWVKGSIDYQRLREIIAECQSRAA
jgi:CheY-like chemotaxis protein